MEALRFRWSGSLSVSDSAPARNALRGGTMRRVLTSRIKSCERYTRNHDFAGEVCGAHQTGRAPAGAHRSWDPRGQFLVRACPRMARRAPMGQGRMRNAECRVQNAEWRAGGESSCEGARLLGGSAGNGQFKADDRQIAASVHWIPACAGMTTRRVAASPCQCAGFPPSRE